MSWHYRLYETMSKSDMYLFFRKMDERTCSKEETTKMHSYQLTHITIPFVKINKKDQLQDSKIHNY